MRRVGLTSLKAAVSPCARLSMAVFSLPVLVSRKSTAPDRNADVAFITSITVATAVKPDREMTAGRAVRRRSHHVSDR